MRQFYEDIKNAIRYALSDRYAIIVIGGIFLLASLINKYADNFLRLSNLILLYVVGYASFISWYTINGRDKHPNLKNVKRMAWEGFKKSTITMVYSFFLAIAAINANSFYSSGRYLPAIALTVLFLMIYLTLIGGLFNRYLNGGVFLKAFDVPEIVRLLKSFDDKTFIRVIVAVIISQTFIVSVFVNFDQGFSLVELLFTISTFFLSPFLYIVTKRLTGLQVRNLLN